MIIAIGANSLALAQPLGRRALRQYQNHNADQCDVTSRPPRKGSRGLVGLGLVALRISMGIALALGPTFKLIAAKRGGEVFPSFPKPGRTLISIAAAYQGWKQQVRVVRWLLAAILLAAILVYRGPYAFTECACGGSKRRADLKWATPCYYSVCC